MLQSPYLLYRWLEVDTLYKKAKDPAVLELSQPLREAMRGETRSLFLLRQLGTRS